MEYLVGAIFASAFWSVFGLGMLLVYKKTRTAMNYHLQKWRQWEQEYWILRTSDAIKPNYSISLHSRSGDENIYKITPDRIGSEVAHKKFKIAFTLDNNDLIMEHGLHAALIENPTDVIRFFCQFLDLDLVGTESLKNFDEEHMNVDTFNMLFELEQLMNEENR